MADAAPSPPVAADGEPSAPLSALRDSIERKGAMSYYFAHASTSAPLKTTLGDVPRLLSSTGGGGGGAAEAAAPSGARVEKVNKWSWYDDDACATVLVDVDAVALAAVGADAVTVNSGADFAELRVALADKTLALRLAGFTGALAGARAIKGKARVSLKLTKATPGAWAKLLGGHSSESFGDDD
jgi:hypothetical protein